MIIHTASDSDIVSIGYSRWSIGIIDGTKGRRRINNNLTAGTIICYEKRRTRDHIPTETRGGNQTSTESIALSIKNHGGEKRGGYSNYWEGGASGTAETRIG